MVILCDTCGYDQNPDDAEFCDACGANLKPPENPTIKFQAEQSSEQVVVDDLIPDPIYNAPAAETVYVNPPQTYSPATIIQSSTAKLIAKESKAPIPEFIIEGNALIGIFDPDTGPVEIDLENFVGNETVSRQHAEIYQDGGVWKIKDLGSTNGVFIKPVGQTRFNARINAPTILNAGDEIAIAKIRFLFQI